MPKNIFEVNMLGKVQRVFGEPLFRCPAGAEIVGENAETYRVTFTQSERQHFGSKMCNGALVGFVVGNVGRAETLQDMHLIRANPSKELLEEIRDWRVEGEDEDMQRYFYRDEDEIAGMLSGRRCYVLGRKGTGKTALANYIQTLSNFETHCVKLSFDDYPLADLYRFRTHANRYVSLWKLLIYSQLAELILGVETTTSASREALVRVIRPEKDIGLIHKIRRWLGPLVPKPSVEIQDVKFALEFPDGGSNALETYLEDRLALLQQALAAAVPKGDYFILFDQLDQGYRDLGTMERRGEYRDLLDSLFIAIKQVKRETESSIGNVRPILFLRDDIFHEFLGPNMAKRLDASIWLNWNFEKLKEMVAHRISRAGNRDSKVAMLDQAMADFSAFGIWKDGKGLFVQILERTNRTPRDFVVFLRACADKALTQRKNCVDQGAFYDAELEYSRIFKIQLQDELSTTMPSIKAIFDVLKELRAPTFKRERFVESFRMHAAAHSELADLDPTAVLAHLFKFGIVGNFKNQSRYIFSYLNEESVPDFTSPFVVHKGLTRVLELH